MAKAIKYSLVFIIFFSIGEINPIKAQTPIEKYEQESILLRWGTYVKNGEKHSIGAFGNKILKELELSEAAVLEGEKYKKNRNISLSLSLAGLGTVIAGMALEEEAVLWSGLAVSLVSIPISVKAINNLQKAVWLRNRDILR